MNDGDMSQQEWAYSNVFLPSVWDRQKRVQSRLELDLTHQQDSEASSSSASGSSYSFQDNMLSKPSFQQYSGLSALAMDSRLPWEVCRDQVSATACSSICSSASTLASSLFSHAESFSSGAAWAPSPSFDAFGVSRSSTGVGATQYSNWRLNDAGVARSALVENHTSGPDSAKYRDDLEEFSLGSGYPSLR